ncbi:uncharacterized protein LOC128228123 [Mya arenaria]|uniref:uncharacterized protein LOC128228123 n=1 Tax=Mya arenaria TaxID=6604 RepID=UPI0022E99430|nr:uncharacterized protein LOC128228123 [Mya arenaria]
MFLFFNWDVHKVKSQYQMAKQRRGISALVYNRNDKLFYRGKVEGTLQKRGNNYFYNIRLNGDDEIVPVDRSDVEFRGGAMPWREPKPGDKTLVEPISRPDRRYSFPNYVQNTSWSNNLIGERRSAFVEGVVKRLPIPTEEIRRYHVVVGSGKKKKTLHVSRHQMKPLGGNKEDIQPVKTETKDKNIQAPKSEPVSGVVLARWRDDGWFYFGKVVSSKEDEYFIKDGFGFKEMMHKSHLLTETDQKFQVVQPGDKVVALHPNYIFSYAPAAVERVYRLNGADLTFYDNTTGTLPWSEIYKISHQKYADCVRHIEQKEKEMLQAEVIVLDVKCGHFQSGTVSKHIDNQMFTVTMTKRNGVGHLEQQANHMFLRQTIPSNGADLKSLKYVIGRVNDVYLPAEICKSTDTNEKTMPDETITIIFCNREKAFVRLNDVYHINKNYFDFAVDEWNRANDVSE